ncbi:sulfite exporter TauE/SafE family protein [Marivibrio halodurans]|uniref:Probable membrane transporter protein n=1 Tax=Marivibrio halodurans TaxID=2039722 RepID=A0A8J7V379_9PROT|nr:sulfite exporter TauE/SafE family protein [Marivibrio halodurans]MBP5856534.1 sulfite exporter TauE/SafE family protein [Marivibrio halodurans]
MLPIWDQVVFLCVVAFGCYTQAITGFALGLIVIALSALFGVMSIEMSSIVVTMITLVNASIALWRSGCTVRWSRVIPLSLASAPTIYLGLLLLGEMTVASQELLRILLGATIVGCSLMLVLNPKPLPRESSRTSFGVLGFVSGILGGLFTAYGPPIIFQFYRQPLPLPIIRDSLLMIFLLLSIERFGFLVLQDGLPLDAMFQAALAVPVTLAFTLLGGRLPPPMSEAAMRRAAFILLMLAGLAIMGLSILAE